MHIFSSSEIQQTFFVSWAFVIILHPKIC